MNATLAEELEKLEGIKRKQAVYQRQYDEALVDLRTQVLEGETTGDTIKDYLLAIKDFENKPLELMLRGLSQKVNFGVDKELGIVYLVTRHKGQLECSGAPSSEIVWKQEQIGIVTESMQFNVRDGSVIIPAREKPLVIDKDWLYCLGERQSPKVIHDWVSRRNRGIGDNNSALAQILFKRVPLEGEIKVRTLFLGPEDIKEYSQAAPKYKQSVLLKYAREK